MWTINAIYISCMAKSSYFCFTLSQRASCDYLFFKETEAAFKTSFVGVGGGHRNGEPDAHDHHDPPCANAFFFYLI